MILRNSVLVLAALAASLLLTGDSFAVRQSSTELAIHVEVLRGSTIQDLPEAAKLDLEVVKLYQEGKLDEAIPLAKRVLKIREKLLPADDPLLADSVSNLAALYLAKQNFDDAESLLKRALSIYEKDPASNALILAKTLENMAQVRRFKGDVRKTEELFLRALAIKEKALNSSHDEIAWSLNNLVEFYLREKQPAKAKPLLQRLVTLKSLELGESDQKVGRLLERMACLMHTLDEKAEAESVEARANHILYSDLATKTTPVSLPGEIFNCKLIDNPRPDLRSILRPGRFSGGSIRMEVAVETDEAGNVTSVRYIGKDPKFKSAAEKAALNAKLRPTIVDGRPVKVEGVIIHQWVIEARLLTVPVTP